MVPIAATPMPPAERLFSENIALKAELEDLRAQVAWFQRQVFGGGRSEKMPADLPAQTSLGLAESAQAERAKQAVAYERRTPSPEKRPISAEVFAGLPVTETVEIVPDEVKAEPEAFERIGEERTFEGTSLCPNSPKREIVCPKFKRKAGRWELGRLLKNYEPPGEPEWSEEARASVYR